MGRKPVFALATALMTSVALAGCNNTGPRAPSSQPLPQQVAKGPNGNNLPNGNGQFTGQVGGGTTMNGPNGSSNFNGTAGGTFNSGNFNQMPPGPTLGNNNPQNRSGVTQTGFNAPSSPTPMGSMPSQPPQQLPPGFTQPPQQPSFSGPSTLPSANNQGKNFGPTSSLPPQPPGNSQFGTSQQATNYYDPPSLPSPSSVPSTPMPNVQPVLMK